MYTSLRTPFYKVFFKSAGVFWLLPVFIAFLSQSSNADQSSLLSLTSPAQVQVVWTTGPADASLGTLADIKIPEGYRFTDATGAGALLARMNNPIPEGLVGIITPESGQWWVVLTYKDIGYVKDAEKGGIDAAAILKTISDRANRQNEDRTLHGLPLITSVDWALAPVIDAKTHALEWAVRAKTQSAEVINHTVRLLGRQGLLDATAVAPYQTQAAANLVPLKELVKNISFKQGQRYTDYQPGDKVSTIGLAGLITGDDDEAVASQQSEAVAPGKSAGVWGWYVFAGVIAGGGLMLVRGVVQRHHKARRVPATGSLIAGNGMGNGHVHPVPVPAAATPAVPAIATSDLQPVKSKTDEVKPGGTTPKMAVAQNGVNGSSNRPAHRRGARRKKIFDYHRFYTDTVMKLSSSGYTAEVTPRNGHTNGHSEGHSSAPAQEAQPASYGAMNQAIVQSHLDLIANQKVLIEEQKRLVQEQTKLIAEKNKFIQEQNELLERQTAMIDQYSLKLG